MFEYYLFDLDGTLTDSGPGITNSVAYALRKYGIEEQDIQKLNKFVGPPLAESFMKYYGFSKEEANRAIDYYREYYTSGGMFENSVYEGVEQMLDTLKSSGKVLIVATSKPELFAEQILEHFGLAKYFDCIAGASMDEVRVKKSEVIAYALDRCNITDTSHMVMVGDRENDIRGAKDNGMTSIGVLFGYGSRQELEEAGADYIVERALDVCTI